jgi:hypothetical protein
MPNVFRILFNSADAGTLKSDPLVQEAVERLQAAAQQLSAITIHTLSETAPDFERSLLQQQIGEASALVRTLHQLFSGPGPTAVNLADGLTVIRQIERLAAAVQAASLDKFDGRWKANTLKRLRAAYATLDESLSER